MPHVNPGHSNEVKLVNEALEGITTPDDLKRAVIKTIEDANPQNKVQTIKVERQIGIGFQRAFVALWNMTIERTELGLKPKEFNQKIHGYYKPWHFYGKPDTPFGDLKLTEIPGWLARREKGLTPFVRLISRAAWRWKLKYAIPRYSGGAAILQLLLVGSALGYTLHLPHHMLQQQFIYHW